MISNLKRRDVLGFTLIEIIIVIVVMSILSTIMIVNYSYWKQNSIASSVKSDLMNAGAAMENARNYGAGYPSSLSGIYVSSEGVVLSVASSDAKNYCIDATSSKDATVLFYIDSQYKKSEPQTGTCAGRAGVVGTPTGIVAATASTSSITVTWTPVSGATGYNLQKSTNASFTDPVNITNVISPYISTGLSSATTYYYRVQAVYASSSSPWSSSASAPTSHPSIATPTAPVVAANTVASTTTYTWPAVSCAADQKVRYRYQYTISPAGYDSGWVSYGSSLSAVFTTAGEGQDYALAVQAQCYDTGTVSMWSTSGSASYYRPGTWKVLSEKCGIASNDNTYCWGQNNYGQLGNNSTSNSLVPVAIYTAGVLSGKTIKAISSNEFHTCAIASDNNAYCWGNNENGKFGNNSTTNSSVPVAVSTAGVLSGKTIKAISAGKSHTCAIASDNNAYCWGSNDYGRLGNNSTTQSLVPVAVNTAGVLSGKTIKEISAGQNHTCAIASDNNAYCWGFNYYGQLGNNSTTQSLVPVAVNTAGVLSGKTVKGISVGEDHTCVIASDNNAYCWGANGTYYRLGNNLTANSSVPVAVNTAGVLSGKTIKFITASAGEIHTCVIASDNNAYCWGNATNGKLGNSPQADAPVPAAVYASGALSGKTVISISEGLTHTCALASDKNVYCWGLNNYGQLGNNSNTSSTVPTITNAPF